MIAVWLKMKKGKHMAALATRVHIHPLTSNFYPREKYAKRLSFLSVQVLRSLVRSCWHQAMSKINTEPLVFSDLPSSSLCHRHGHWKRWDAVDVHQISCLSNCPWCIFSVPRKTFEFWEGTRDNESDQHQVQTTQHHWRQLFPHIPPFTVYLPTNEKPYLVWFYSSKRCSKEYILCDTASGLKEKDALFWLISKKMSAILFRLFVRSFFYLPYCSYKMYRWVDECIVLLLLTCLRLYGFAVSMFGGEKGTGGQKPWFKKKKKIRTILYTM